MVLLANASQAGPGKARQGKASQARLGGAWRNVAGHGNAGEARRGQARLGNAGMARHGTARRGEARRGEARRGATAQQHRPAADYRRTYFLMNRKMVSVREALIELHKKHGSLTPEIVVEAARPKTSPLHSSFEWNDKVAGEQYRLVQAAFLIRTVKVRREVRAGTESVVRAFVNVRPVVQQAADEDEEDASKKGVYVSIDQVLESEQWTRQMLDSAMRDLRAFRRKYETLSALAPIFRAIEQLELSAAAK
jgi:hypothetical protein